MNRAAHALVLCLLILPAACGSGAGPTTSATSAKAPRPKLDDPRDRVGYMVGLDLAKRIGPIKDEVDIDTVIAALRAAHAGAPAQLDDKQIAAVRSEFVAHLQAKRDAALKALAQKNRSEGERYLSDNARRDGVATTVSGLQYRIDRNGSGAKPSAESTVRVNYVGRLLDGREFESTYATDHPAEFPLNRIMPGLREGLMLMAPGAKSRLWIPAALAYGEAGVPGQIEPNATLVFDVELLEVAR